MEIQHLQNSSLLSCDEGVVTRRESTKRKRERENRVKSSIVVMDVHKRSKGIYLFIE